MGNGAICPTRFSVFHRISTVEMKYEPLWQSEDFSGCLSVFENQVLFCKSQISFLISHLGPVCLSLMMGGHVVHLWILCRTFLGSNTGSLTNLGMEILSLSLVSLEACSWTEKCTFDCFIHKRFRFFCSLARYQKVPLNRLEKLQQRTKQLEKRGKTLMMLCSLILRIQICFSSYFMNSHWTSPPEQNML